MKPMLVFKRAFKEYSIKEYDYFISGIFYFSQQMYRSGPESNQTIYPSFKDAGCSLSYVGKRS
jgi:hypothetical protein